MADDTIAPDIYKSIIDSSPEAILLLDPEARIITSNPAVVELTGYTPQELEGKSIDITYTAAERPLFAKSFAIFKTQKRIHLERLLLRKDGTTRYVELLAAELPDGNITEFIKDITERKEASTKILLSEQRFRALVESAPYAIISFSTGTGKFVDVNESAMRLFGMSREELLQIGPAQVSPEIQPDGRTSEEAARGYIGEALHGKTPVFEWIHRAKDGHDFPCEVRLIKLPESSGPPILRSSILDISARREAAKALEAQLAFNKALVENSLDLIAILNPDGTVKYEGPRDESSFGYATGELKSMNMFELIHPEDRPSVEETFRNVMTSKERRTMTFRLRAKDGSWIFLQTLAVNLADNPYVQGILVSMRDITNLKKAQEDVGRLEELDRLNKILVGREMKMIELKEELKRLKGE